MKNLRFVFMSGEEEVINTTTSYQEEDRDISFDIEGVRYKFSLKDDFSFIRSNENEEFHLYKNGNNSFATFKLIKENIEVDIKVLDLDVVFEDKKSVIKYNIESDENSIKTIFLSFD